MCYIFVKIRHSGKIEFIEKSIVVNEKRRKGRILNANLISYRTLA